MSKWLQQLRAAPALRPRGGVGRGCRYNTALHRGAGSAFVHAMERAAQPDGWELQPGADGSSWAGGTGEQSRDLGLVRGNASEPTCLWLKFCRVGVGWCQEKGWGVGYVWHLSHVVPAVLAPAPLHCTVLGAQGDEKGFAPTQGTRFHWASRPGCVFGLDGGNKGRKQRGERLCSLR